MKSKTVEAIIRQGIRSLIMSMTESYWPAVGDNDMSERNITAHVGHCFLESGWHLVTEVSFRKNAGSRLDMLVLNRKSRAMVVIEGKRLESAVKAKELSDDAKRIKRFRLDEDNAWYCPKRANSYGVLLAFTWSPEVQRWWRSGTHSIVPDGCRGVGWKPLGRRLDDYKATCGALMLPGYGETAGKYNNFWALYAIFKQR